MTPSTTPDPPTSTTGTKPPPRGPVNRGAVAGTLLVASIVLCGGIGLGLGALIGAPALLSIVGVFAGLGVGFALVYDRFKDL